MREAWLLAIFALGGCVMNNQPKIRPLWALKIATAPYQDLATTALTGSLLYEGGCLLFRDDQSRELLMPVWPAGSSFNGTAVNFHQPGKADQWLAVAQEVLLYGQPIRWPTLSGPPYMPFEHQCGVYPPFFVTGTRPAD
jgi:hypothetical protein